MYEDLTFEVLLERMLARITTAVDKTEGSLIYNALAPEAWELAQAYVAIDHVYDTTFADTAPREELVRRARERGIEPKEATKALLQGEFNMEVPVGSRFSLDDYNYVVTEKISETASDKLYKLQCEIAGTTGNKKFGTLTPIEFIEGLTSAVLTKLLIPAVDDEDTEAFRERYFASFQSQAFGGNIADYISTTESIKGVGGAKYHRASEENSHVKIQIIDSEFQVPSSTLVDLVQQTLDPKSVDGQPVTQGHGLGMAPIGHIVDVEGCISSTLNITAKFTYDTGFTWESVQNKVSDAVDKYFLELRKTWADTDGLIIRLAQIESRLLSIDGILDISNTAINNSQNNLILAANEIPVRGTVNAN
jgi:Uncharacterized homolog of phage Mu protein gp47